MSENNHIYDRVVSDVRLLHRNLEILHAGIVVAAMALRCQDAERDREIARVLEHLVADRLADQIVRAIDLLAVLHLSETGAADGDAQEGRSDERHGVRESGRPLRYVQRPEELRVRRRFRSSPSRRTTESTAPSLRQLS